MSTRELAPVTLERTFDSSPEDVFDAWTNPDVLRRWWAAQPTWSSPGCDVDLRVGGRYRLQMRRDDGALHVVGGEYREIERPKRLVYTWCWEGDDVPHPGHVSLVTVEFRADGERTTVVLEHSGLPSEESRRGHADGWTGTLESLASRVFSHTDAHLNAIRRRRLTMGNYLFAYRGGAMAQTDEEREAAMAAWGSWFGSLGDAIVDAGNPFGPSTSVGGDGPGTPLSGYSVIKADSIEAAGALAGGCPVLAHGGSVDVYETIPIM